jgi:hypothetical protein
VNADQKAEAIAAFADATFGRDDLSFREAQALWLLIADRAELGTLGNDLVTEKDFAAAKLVSLGIGLAYGDEMGLESRKLAGRALLKLLPESLALVSDKLMRRDASVRGGKAGRTSNPCEVIETWDGFFAASGKRSWADDQTASEKSLSPRTVRRIRTEAGRK